MRRILIKLTLAPLASRLVPVGLVSLVMVVTLVGCALHKPTLPDPSVEAAREHAETVVREVRAEAEALRAEIAQTRIKMAKKEAEIRELQRQLQQLRQEGAQIRQESVELKRTKVEAQQGLEAKQGEMMVLRAERDGLLQVKNDMQRQLAELPKLRQTLTEATAAQEKLQSRVVDLEASLATVTTELAEIKHMMAEDRQKAAGKAAKKKTKTEAKPAAPVTRPDPSVSGSTDQAPASPTPLMDPITKAQATP
jgi:peptidoglycan hydrolase CwlO-like protein